MVFLAMKTNFTATSGRMQTGFHFCNISNSYFIHQKLCSGAQSTLVFIQNSV